MGFTCNLESEETGTMLRHKWNAFHLIPGLLEHNIICYYLYKVVDEDKLFSSIYTSRRNLDARSISPSSLVEKQISNTLYTFSIGYLSENNSSLECPREYIRVL